MHPQRDVAGGVRQVPAHDGPGGVARRGDRLDVQMLAAVVVHRAEQHQRDPMPFPLQESDDILAAQTVLARARCQPDDGGVRVEAVEPGLAADRVAVGGKGGVLDDDRVPLRGGPVEADHHQVQVHRQRVHGHDLAGQRTDQARRRFAEQLVIAHPRPLRLGVPLDRPLLPLGRAPRPAGCGFPLGCRPRELPAR